MVKEIRGLLYWVDSVLNPLLNPRSNCTDWKLEIQKPQQKHRHSVEVIGIFIQTRKHFKCEHNMGTANPLKLIPLQL